MNGIYLSICIFVASIKNTRRTIYLSCKIPNANTGSICQMYDPMIRTSTVPNPYFYNIHTNTPTTQLTPASSPSDTIPLLVSAMESPTILGFYSNTTAQRHNDRLSLCLYHYHHRQSLISAIAPNTKYISPNRSRIIT